MFRFKIKVLSFLPILNKSIVCWDRRIICLANLILQYLQWSEEYKNAENEYTQLKKPKIVLEYNTNVCQNMVQNISFGILLLVNYLYHS